jgi:hypothetical protein
MVGLRAALAAAAPQPAPAPEQAAQPTGDTAVTLADVLDALNVFNKPKPSEGDEPWTDKDFIAVTHLPDFINVIRAAWFAAPQPAPVALTADPLWPVDGLYPDIQPPATSRDRWMFDQGRLAERRASGVQRQPLTEEQIEAGGVLAGYNVYKLSAFHEGARFAESQHGIKGGK